MSNPPSVKKANKPIVRTDHKTMRSVFLELLNSRTQHEAAKLLGISAPTFCEYLKPGAQRRPQRTVARKMAAKLGVDVDWFCSLTPPINK